MKEIKADTPHEKQVAKAKGEILPPKFLESVLEILGSHNIDKKRIKYEG